MKHSKMTSKILAVLAMAGLTIAVQAQHEAITKPVATEDLVFEEIDGLVAVEAEHFFKQTKTGKRAWYLTTAKTQAGFNDDADGPHVMDASGGAYLECLPDTRHHHGHKLIGGENFSNVPGALAVLHYQVHINNPGRYYVWVRAHSTGSEDNGLHVGFDGQWPESGQRLQWCEGKRTWRWESKQRTQKNHCGEPHKIYLDIEKPGRHTIHFSQREDGFEFDKFILTKDREFARPQDAGPASKVKSGVMPRARAVPAGYADPAPAAVSKTAAHKPVATPRGKARALTMNAIEFPLAGSGYYNDRGKWLAINPDRHKQAKATAPFPFANGSYHVTLHAVGESDGQSTFQVFVNDEQVGDFKCPLGTEQFEEGAKFNRTWKNVEVNVGDVVEVRSQIASADGQEWSRARWARLSFVPADGKTRQANAKLLARAPAAARAKPAASLPPLVLPRGQDGSGKVTISGELRQWHKVTLTLDGPYAHERDNAPNPFRDHRMTVRFTHESGAPDYEVPGYFAADGKAANSSAESGTQWRAHLSPDKPGRWNYVVRFVTGKDAALDADARSKAVAKYDGRKGSFSIGGSDKTGRDLRAKGRLQYVGERYLRYTDSGEYFLKAGADAPETFLGYADFDNTIAGKAQKVPLKTWAPHLKDWRAGDPTWKDGKGKGMIGAINYLAGKGCNVFSFLTYNAGGDGDNVWPFVERNDKFHYDCSKLDQWGIIFDHATSLGHYLHFKLQETEMDDNNRGHNVASKGRVPTSLDGGDLGPERKLYCRELIARFGHLLALNWNLGEENTQSTQQQRDMAQYIADTDPYDHLIVVHTFPNQQDKVYRPLLGGKSPLRGMSLQNSSIKDTHVQVVKWVNESVKAGQPWVVAFDESGTAQYAQVPDLGYEGFNGFDGDGKKVHTQHEVRKYTLWGTLMGGGAGCEYYFGYKLPQNDLVCEDWRSRDQSWDYCRIALGFFRTLPITKMQPADQLVGNLKNDNSKYCFAQENELYVVYLPDGGTTDLDLTDAKGAFDVSWFNPRTGGRAVDGGVRTVRGGGKVSLGRAPTDPDQDWAVVVQRK